MGGTWVNWGQPHVWREISRYNMRKELEISQDYSHGINQFSVNVAGKTSDMNHDEEVSRWVLIESVITFKQLTTWNRTL